MIVALILLCGFVAYCAIGLGLLWLSKDHRQRAFQGPSSLSSLLGYEQATQELLQEGEGLYARFRPYAVVARTVVRAVLGWPISALAWWQEARGERAWLDCEAGIMRESMRGSYGGELPPGDRTETFGSLWDAWIPPAA